MAHESFEDGEVAKILNENFVSIKVDREERPDIDEIYMKAVVAMTGSGGWPMSVFLTPSLEPFYGGTYFPPSPRYGMPSFSNVIRSISQSWKSERKKIVDSATQMKGSLRELYDFKKNPDSKLNWAPIDECYEALMGSFDEKYGGFGDSPKFPTPSNLFFLSRYHSEKKSSLALRAVSKTLDSMMRGGIYDQVGGGFHRYSTDRYWLVPHFEKMLYDNALLIIAYSEGYLITKNEEYARIVRETIDWARREMRITEGGYYSAQDADSDEGEGLFYSWTPDEMTKALSAAGFTEKESLVIAKHFSVTSDGNFERGRTILTFRPMNQSTVESGLDPDQLRALIAKTKKVLLEYRQHRPTPAIDDKILTGWNGLMISALSKAYQILGDESYLALAVSCVEFLLANLSVQNGGESIRLLRRFRLGESKGEAVLEDYAFFANALIDLYEAGFDPKYLEKAIAIAKTMISDFYDKNFGGFYQTGERNSDLIVRAKDGFDGALPSGNSVAALVCLRLAEITTKEEYRTCATDTFLAFWEPITRQPASFTEMLVGLEFLLDKPKEIVISGSKESSETIALISIIRNKFLPNSVLIFADKKIENISPLVQDRLYDPGDKTRVFVCSNFSCKLPSSKEKELDEALND